MAHTFSAGPVRLSGATQGNRAAVVFVPDETSPSNGDQTTGTLHIWLGKTRHTAYHTTEPTPNKGGWDVLWLDEDGESKGHIHFTKKGCSGCGWTLAGMSAEALLASLNGASV